jgi:broad specificity polyphosphatase/5'/3'-nucleotidase SurE
MRGVLSVEAMERVESELDRLVERRAREAKDANAIEELWKQSERAHRDRRREENREAWHSYEMHMCKLHASLSEEHRVKALNFLKQGEGATVMI